MKARLQKVLAAAGIASRRDAEGWIRAGRVSVNGEVATLGASADPERDDIRVDGRRIHHDTRSYWLMNKPRGVLTTTRDPHAERDGRPTVMDLLPESARRRRLFPVGRLDLDSEGLLLLTDDGDVAHALLHPSLGSEREYRVTVHGRLDDATARRLADGPLLDDGPMAPCKVGRRFVRDGRTRFDLTLREGRKRQIRRACALLGFPVERLVRTRMGPLRLGLLEPGDVRRLEAAERRRLLSFASGRRREPAVRSSGATARAKPSRRR